MPVSVGLEVLRNNQFAALNGKRIGLLTNPSAVTHDLISAYALLSNAEGVQLSALFSPEHGFLSNVRDGEKVDHAVDPRTGIPIYSLYGDSRKPSPAMLQDVDLIVVDIQDIGVRYYTYVYTLSYMLEACGENHVEVLILDRPNPLGGNQVIGPILAAGFESFVGRFPIPVCHGLTIGELAQLINQTWNPAPALVKIVQCEGWQRDMTWGDTNLPWVLPSPNMPKLETVWHYPGACLVEGTELSEGRGTSLPFEIIGAPWIDGMELAAKMNEVGLPGVRFRPHSFQPGASKFAGMVCHGIQAHITELIKFDPIKSWLKVVQMIHDLDTDHFSWLEPVHQGGLYHFDRLMGTDEVRKCINSGQPLDNLFPLWKNTCMQFAQSRQQVLIYS